MTNSARPKKTSAAGNGVLDPTLMYRTSALCGALGWGERTWRRARREGLRILKFGRIRYVKGSDAIAFLDQFEEPRVGEGAHD